MAGTPAEGRTVADGDEDLAALAHLLGDLDVVGVADGAFEDTHGDPFFRGMFQVRHGARREFHGIQKPDDALVNVQKRHVTSGTAGQPISGNFDFCHCRFSFHISSRAARAAMSSKVPPIFLPSASARREMISQSGLAVPWGKRRRWR